MVKDYQVVLESVKLSGLGVTDSEVGYTIRRANQETGGSVVEMGGADYMVRASGYLGSLNDFRSVPLKTAAGGIPVTPGDVATVQLGPDIRRREIGRASCRERGCPYV